MKKSILIFLFSAVMTLSPNLESHIPENVSKAIEKHISENGWGGLYYDVLPKIIRENHYKSVIEVGVALGGHAEAILKNTDVKIYYGVDPYLYGYDPDDGFSADVAKYSSASGQQNFDYLYEWVKNVRLKPYFGRYEMIRELSVNASALFEDESIDCIFIDGDHRYEAVLQDLNAWYPKLKPGCLIVGDDYWMPQVERAVQEFFASRNKTVFFFISASGYKSWAVYK